MERHIIISNLFNNLEFPKEMTDLWESQYRVLAEKCDADFKNFSVNYNGNISKHYIDKFSKFWSGKQLIRKMSMLSTFDEIDECFVNGYEWVFAMDADIVINPNADFDISKFNKNVVYFASVDKGLGGRQIFTSNVKDEFLKEYSLKYGNQGVLLISKTVWDSIKDELINYEKIVKYTKPNTNLKRFFDRVDQPILSTALTLNNIEIEGIPNKKNLYLHFVGNQIQRYKDVYGIDDVYFTDLLNTFVNYTGVEISDLNAINTSKWFPLLFHYLNLPVDEKQKLFK